MNTDILEGLDNEEEIQTEIEESDEYMLYFRLKLQELKKQILPNENRSTSDRNYEDAHTSSPLN